ncbi:MAG: DUF1802 family protein [Symploca sp. SIO2E6]|nr:DUF1802 family protein [Symploca sp. SIO2E6]
MESITTHALKEWAIAVDALERGKTIMLLRKGGIREESKLFQVTYNQVLLYPTYEHQQSHLLKAEYASQVKPVTSGWHPETVRIGSWAEITDILAVRDDSAVKALLPYHIWNEQFARERFQWKPHQPLYILLLRTYRLPQPLIIPYYQEYGGCRSWIDLTEAIALDNLVPVMDDVNYTKQSLQIRQIVQSSN